jgi:hypothetical protein
MRIGCSSLSRRCDDHPYYSGPNDADTYLYLYDASLEQIEADDDDGDGFYSLITATLDSGVYYVRVNEYNSDDVIATYYLDLVASSF